MSIRIYVTCDTSDCCSYVSVAATTADEARTRAQARGWTHANDTDRCAFCTIERTPTPPSSSLKIPPTDNQRPH